MAKDERKPEDFIAPLIINGLQGRVMHLPAPSKTRNKEILLIYGHHSSLERWWGLAQVLNRYGAVTMPDLPGFGGMDSMYKIGRAPTLDNLADYLASYVKMRYKRRRVVIAGISFGFLVVTRMLQRYPDLVKKVDFLASAAGFAHHDDFHLSRRRTLFFRYAPVILVNPVLSKAFRYIGLNKYVLNAVYSKTPNAKHKFEGVNDPALFKRMMDREIELWQSNDVRTYMCTTIEMFTVDNCKKQVDLPVWHVYSPTDNYFDHTLVEQHYLVTFNAYHDVPSKTLKHAPSVVADAKESEILVPHKLRRAFLANYK